MSTASTSLTRPPRLALKRWQILAIGWSVPVALVGGYVVTNVVATTAQHSLLDRWEAAVARGRLDATDLSARAWTSGEPVARIAIPAIGLDLVVAEGGDGRRAPSHVPSTVIPGAPGLAAVTGGRFGFGNFFLGLERLRPGDEILVENLSGRVRLVVVSTEIVPGTALRFDRDSEAPALDLVTSSRAWGSEKRLVVHATIRSGENQP